MGTNMMNEKMQEALNRQLNAELYASYLYLSMSAYFASHVLKGFSDWCLKQSEEEKNHAMKFYKYILDRGGLVVLLPIEGPPSTWKSSVSAFEDAYRHEQKTTSLINNLMDLAMAEKDYATQMFMQWFISEQVEEEAMSHEIVEKLKMAKDSSSAVLILDHELGGRQNVE